MYDVSMPPGYPLYLRGLVTIKPVSEEGAMFGQFNKLWNWNSEIRRTPFDSQFTDAILLFAQALQVCGTFRPML